MSRYVDIAPYEDCEIILHKEDEGVRCKDIPTANVAEVVYCADCRWCEDMGMSGLYCNHPDNRNPAGCRPKDYCSDGERRSGDEVQHTQTDGEGDESGTGGMPATV